MTKDHSDGKRGNPLPPLHIVSLELHAFVVLVCRFIGVFICFVLLGFFGFLLL